MPKIVDHDARRSLIIDALWRVVARDGASAVSVRSVAAEAGVSRSGMAYYFKSHGQLLAMAIEQMVQSVTDEILSIDLLGCDVDRATDALQAMVPDTPMRRRQSQVWLLLMAQADASPEVARVLHQLNTTVRAGIHDILQALVNSQLVSRDRDLEVEVATLHALIDGLSALSLTDLKLASQTSTRLVLHRAVTGLAIPMGVNA